MKIAIIGAIYSDNLGDALLCNCTAQLLKNHIPEAEIQLIDIWGATSKNNIQSDDMLRSIVKYIFCHIPGLIQLKDHIRKKERIKGLRNNKWTDIDLAVFAGGQLFQTCFIVELELIADELQKASVPVIYNAISYDVLSDKEQKSISGILNMDNVLAVSTRDDSKEAESLFDYEGITGTFDPAMTVGKIFDLSTLKENNKIGIGVIAGQQKTVIDLIKELERRNIDWQLFCNGDAQDHRTMLHVLKVTGNNAEKVAKRPENPKELVEQICSYSGIIAFRLHASVIALSGGVPCVGLSWNRKVSCFYDKTGSKDYCFRPNAAPTVIVDALLQNMNTHRNINIERYIDAIQNNINAGIDIYQDKRRYIR